MEVFFTLGVHWLFHVKITFFFHRKENNCATCPDLFCDEKGLPVMLIFNVSFQDKDLILTMSKKIFLFKIKLFYGGSVLKTEV